MKRVITYGTFDLLHYGHINLLPRSKIETLQGVAKKSLICIHFALSFKEIRPVLNQ